MKKTMIGLAAAMLLAGAAQAQMIGLDFRTANLSGWHAVETATVNGGSMSNLTDVNGSNTVIDVAFANANGTAGTAVAAAFTAGTIPSGLTGLNGYLYDPGTLTVTFSGLTPGATCHVYVMGSATAAAGPPKSNAITITGGTSTNFTQTCNTALNLIVNDQLGSSAQPLSAYKKTVTANSGGVIVITCAQVEDQWRIAGVAIEQETAAKATTVILF